MYSLLCFISCVLVLQTQQVSCRHARERYQALQGRIFKEPADFSDNKHGGYKGTYPVIKSSSVAEKKLLRNQELQRLQNNLNPRENKQGDNKHGRYKDTYPADKSSSVKKSSRNEQQHRFHKTFNHHEDQLSHSAFESVPRKVTSASGVKSKLHVRPLKVHPQTKKSEKKKTNPFNILLYVSCAIALTICLAAVYWRLRTANILWSHRSEGYSKLSLLKEAVSPRNGKSAESIYQAQTTDQKNGSAKQDSLCSEPRKKRLFSMAHNELHNKSFHSKASGKKNFTVADNWDKMKTGDICISTAEDAAAKYTAIDVSDNEIQDHESDEEEMGFLQQHSIDKSSKTSGGGPDDKTYGLKIRNWRSVLSDAFSSAVRQSESIITVYKNANMKDVERYETTGSEINCFSIDIDMLYPVQHGQFTVIQPVDSPNERNSNATNFVDSRASSDKDILSLSLESCELGESGIAMSFDNTAEGGESEPENADVCLNETRNQSNEDEYGKSFIERSPSEAVTDLENTDTCDDDTFSMYLQASETDCHLSEEEDVSIFLRGDFDSDEQDEVLSQTIDFSSCLKPSKYNVNPNCSNGSELYDSKNTSLFSQHKSNSISNSEQKEESFLSVPKGESRPDIPSELSEKDVLGSYLSESESEESENQASKFCKNGSYHFRRHSVKCYSDDEDGDSDLNVNFDLNQYVENFRKAHNIDEMLKTAFKKY